MTPRSNEVLGGSIIEVSYAVRDGRKKLCVQIHGVSRVYTVASREIAPTIARTASMKKNTVQRVARTAALNAEHGHELPIHANNPADSRAGENTVQPVGWTAALNAGRRYELRIHATQRRER
jgi:hypothetical protein